jgi:hypothetical protein
LLEGTEENHENPDRIAGIQACIRTDDLSSASVEQDRYTSQSVFVFLIFKEV